MSTQVTLNRKFLYAARDYKGVKFVHQGRSKTGIDCLGLAICAAYDIGYDIEPGILNYLPNPGISLYNGIKQCGFVIEIKKEEMIDGDLFLVNFMGRPIHIGIKNDCCIVHAYQPVGFVTEHPMLERFKKRIHSYWRIDWDKAKRI